MKIIFFSDVHKDIDTLKELLNKEQGIYYCLGDSEISKEVLEDYNVISVRGNCDTDNFADNLVVNINNKKILLTHGHLYNVKFTLNNLYFYAKSINSDIVVFGHTHMVTKIEDDINMYNPGSLRDSKSYLVYENNEFKIKYL